MKKTLVAYFSCTGNTKRVAKALAEVFIGFPIWWYVAPHIIKTFLESYDFTGKTIVPFATSGGSGMGRTVEELQKSCFSSVKWDKGKIWNGNPSEEALASWAKDFI